MNSEESAQNEDSWITTTSTSGLSSEESEAIGTENIESKTESSVSSERNEQQLENVQTTLIFTEESIETKEASITSEKYVGKITVTLTSSLSSEKSEVIEKTAILHSSERNEQQVENIQTSTIFAEESIEMEEGSMTLTKSNTHSKGSIIITTATISLASEENEEDIVTLNVVSKTKSVSSEQNEEKTITAFSEESKETIEALMTSSDSNLQTEYSVSTKGIYEDKENKNMESKTESSLSSDQYETDVENIHSTTIFFEENIETKETLMTSKKSKIENNSSSISTSTVKLSSEGSNGYTETKQDELQTETLLTSGNFEQSLENIQTTSDFEETKEAAEAIDEDLENKNIDTETSEKQNSQKHEHLSSESKFYSESSRITENSHISLSPESNFPSGGSKITSSSELLLSSKETEEKENTEEVQTNVANINTAESEETENVTELSSKTDEKTIVSTTISYSDAEESKASIYTQKILSTRYELQTISSESSSSASDSTKTVAELSERTIGGGNLADLQPTSTSEFTTAGASSETTEISEGKSEASESSTEQQTSETSEQTENTTNESSEEAVVTAEASEATATSETVENEQKGTTESVVASESAEENTTQETTEAEGIISTESVEGSESNEETTIQERTEAEGSVSNESAESLESITTQETTEGEEAISTESVEVSEPNEESTTIETTEAEGSVSTESVEASESIEESTTQETTETEGLVSTESGEASESIEESTLQETTEVKGTATIKEEETSEATESNEETSKEEVSQEHSETVSSIEPVGTSEHVVEQSVTGITVESSETLEESTLQKGTATNEGTSFASEENSIATTEAPESLETSTESEVEASAEISNMSEKNAESASEEIATTEGETVGKDSEENQSTEAHEESSETNNGTEVEATSDMSTEVTMLQSTESEEIASQNISGFTEENQSEENKPESVETQESLETKTELETPAIGQTSEEIISNTESSSTIETKGTGSVHEIASSAGTSELVNENTSQPSIERTKAETRSGAESSAIGSNKIENESTSLETSEQSTETIEIGSHATEESTLGENETTYGSPNTGTTEVSSEETHVNTAQVKETATNAAVGSKLTPAEENLSTSSNIGSASVPKQPASQSELSEASTRIEEEMTSPINLEQHKSTICKSCSTSSSSRSEGTNKVTYGKGGTEASESVDEEGYENKLNRSHTKHGDSNEVNINTSQTGEGETKPAMGATTETSPEEEVTNAINLPDSKHKSTVCKTCSSSYSSGLEISSTATYNQLGTQETKSLGEESEKYTKTNQSHTKHGGENEANINTSQSSEAEAISSNTEGTNHPQATKSEGTEIHNTVKQTESENIEETHSVIGSEATKTKHFTENGGTEKESAVEETTKINKTEEQTERENLETPSEVSSQAPIGKLKDITIFDKNKELIETESTIITTETATMGKLEDVTIFDKNKELIETESTIITTGTATMGKLEDVTIFDKNKELIETESIIITTEINKTEEQTESENLETSSEVSSQSTMGKLKDVTIFDKNKEKIETESTTEKEGTEATKNHVTETHEALSAPKTESTSESGAQEKSVTEEEETVAIRLHGDQESTVCKKCSHAESAITEQSISGTEETSIEQEETGVSKARTEKTGISPEESSSVTNKISPGSDMSSKVSGESSASGTVSSGPEEVGSVSNEIQTEIETTSSNEITSGNKPIVIVVKPEGTEANKTALENVLHRHLDEVTLEYVDYPAVSNKPKTLETATINVPISKEDIESCNKTDFDHKDNCFCDVENYLYSLRHKIEEEGKVSLYNIDCKRFVRFKNGLIVGNKVTPIRRKRRSLLYFDNMNEKNDIIEYLDIHGVFHKDSAHIPTSSLDTFALPGTSVTITCSSNAANRSTETEEISHVQWTFAGLDDENAKPLPEASDALEINDVSIKSSGNYTCTKNEIPETHELEVITFPIYEVAMDIFYKINDTCNIHTGDVLYAYLPKMISPILCGNDKELCRVDMHMPRCLFEDDESYFNVTISAIVEPTAKFLSDINQEKCDINCKLKVYSNAVQLVYRNTEMLEKLSVHSRLSGVDPLDFAPTINEKSTSPIVTKQPKILVSCPGGYGIEKEKQSVCVICPKQTFSPEGEAYCKICPAGQYQPKSASIACVPCSSPVDDKMCLRMLYSNTHVFKLYVGLAFGIVILIIAAILFWTNSTDNESGAPRTTRYFEGSLRHRAMLAKRNTDVEKGEIQPLLADKNTVKRVKSPVPPQVPPPDF